MASAAYTAYNTEGVDNSAPAAFAQSPRLLIMLCASLLLHAIVIGLWPDAAGAPSTATTTARITLHIQHQTATQTTQTQTQQPAADSATTTMAAPADNQTAAQAITRHTTAKPRLNKPTQPRAASATAAKTTTHSNASSASRTAAQINTPLPTYGSDELRRQLNNRLQHALIAHFDYPLIARRRGWEGVVHIGVHVEANGKLSRVRLVATSGHASLDRAALQSLGRIEHLKNSAGWLNGQQIDLIFPVRYQLIDS